MQDASLDKQTLKETFKEAIAEALEEQHDLLRDMLSEVLEDFALAQAIREGRKTKSATRQDVMDVLKGNS